MLRFITFVALILFVCSNAKQLCLPNEMHADMMIGDPYVPIQNKNHIVSYFFDSNNRRIRRTYYTGDTELLFYNENKSFQFNATMCGKGGTDSWDNVLSCIPNGAVASKPYRLGFNLSAVDYFWYFQNTFYQMTISESFPLELMTWGNNTSPQDSGITRIRFQNVVPRIDDTHAFDVPAVCKQATAILTG